MPNKIKPKRSFTPNSVPLTTDLTEVGELAINWADGIAYTRNSAGNIVSIALGGSGGGSGEDTLLRSLFVPPAPTSVSASAGNARATVSWTAPSGVISQAPITDYTVQFQPSGGSWQTFSDGTSTATSATVTGLTNGTAYQFRVAAVNAVGTGGYSAASSAVTPTSGDPYWSNVQLLLPGDTSTNDVSSYLRSVTAVGGAAVSTAQKRWGAGSIYFDGSGDWVATGETSALTFGTGDLTIEFWARPTGSQPSTPRIMGNLSANAFTTGDWVLTQNLGCGLYAFNYSSSTPIVSLGSSLTADTWTHVAIVRSGNNWTMYKDGTVVSTNTWSGSLDSGTRRLVVGSSGSTVEAWNGYIDDLRVTKAARTITLPAAAFPTVGPGGVPTDGYFSSVSLLLHADGTGSTFVDSSPTPKDVASTGAVQSAAQSRWGGKSALFNGSSDGLTVPNSSDLNLAGVDWVIEAWLYPTSSPQYTCVVGKRSGSEPTSYYIYMQNGVMGFYNGSVVFSTSATIPANQWTHIAWSMAGGTLRAYAGGTRIGEWSSVTISEVDTSLKIGRHFSSLVEAFAGYIDDLRITKGSSRGYTGTTIPVPTAAFPDA